MVGRFFLIRFGIEKLCFMENNSDSEVLGKRDFEQVEVPGDESKAVGIQLTQVVGKDTG
jgi:hypothetical protein